ncbi:MAG: hypothetical protein ABI401_16335 [Candidatus Dormibacter sp.]
MAPKRELPARRLSLDVVVLATSGATEADDGLGHVLVGRGRDVKPAEQLQDLPFHNFSRDHSLGTLINADMAAAVAPAAVRRCRPTPHGSAAVCTADDTGQEIGARLGGFLLSALAHFRERVSLSDRQRELRLRLGNQGRMTSLDQLAVRAAPVALDVPEVELMVVQDRADRFVGYLDPALAAISGDVEVTRQGNVRILTGAVEVEDLADELDLSRVPRRLQDAMLPVVTERDGAAVLTAILLHRNRLRRSLGVEFALQFSPHDSHPEERTAVRRRGIDLLSDADKVDVVFSKLLEEREVIALVAG